MNRYLGRLDYLPAPVPNFYDLTSMLGFESARANITIIALPGFRTNFVTGRKLFVVRRVVTDQMNRAAVIHDQLYDKKPVSRAMADAIFRDAMLVDDVPAWRAWLAWSAVRVCGWQFY